MLKNVKESKVIIYNKTLFFKNLYKLAVYITLYN